jgi:hypothetical protein
MTNRNTGTAILIAIPLSHYEVFGSNELYPLDAALRRDVVVLEERFDTKLGPHTRRWAYGQLLPHTRLLTSLWLRGVPLAAPVLLPGECRAVQPALDDLPPAMREQVLHLRNTAGGQFALRLFSEERGSPSAICG